MNKIIRLLISAVLSLAMITAIVPMSASAATQVEKIIEYAKYIADNDPHKYDTMCLKFCAECYKYAGCDTSAPADSAYEAGTKWIESTSSENIPVGALVFFGKEWSPYGHVGIYAGDGKMYDAESQYGGVMLRSFRVKDYRGWGWYGRIKPTGAGATVMADTAKPSISNVSVTSTTAGYSISMSVSDNVGIASVTVKSWTDKNGQDDVQTVNATLSADKKSATSTVTSASHNSEKGAYTSLITAYDAAGNSATYTVNWRVETYTISYNLNGGTGAYTNQTKLYKTDIKLHTGTPTRTGYFFTGWNTKADGTGANYASGAVYNGNASLTLYANWKMYGDVTGDKRVNSSDALYVLQATVGQRTFDVNQKLCADVNKDNKVNSNDALKILQYSVGIISKLG